MSYLSVFEERFDVGVYGTGFAGLAAAWQLSREGKRVLLFGARMAVAWESGQCFATETGELNDALWQDFVGELAERGLAGEGLLDCAGAEVVSSARLRGAEAPRVLLGAYLLGAMLTDGHVTGVKVATKSGSHVLRADAWVDATDEGALYRLVAPAAVARKPVAYEQRAWLANAAVESAADFARAELPSDVALERVRWKHEFMLCVRSERVLGRSELAERVFTARDALGEVGAGSAVACFAFHALPVYAATGKTSDSDCLEASAVFTASPAFSQGRVALLSERFSLGLEAARRVSASTPGKALAAGGEAYRSLPVQARACEVLVAGAGTGGAVAALTALREGGDLLIVDTASTAGGIGTGGMICGYFHGHPGGYFEEYDRRTKEVEARLDPVHVSDTTSRWHHEAKRIAFDQMMNAERFLGESLVYEVEVERGFITCVRVASAETLYEIRAGAVIDGTGDGDLAALAGASFDYGRPGDGFPLSYSQSCIRIEYGRLGAKVGGNNYDAGWVDATDPEDLTRARLDGVAQYLRDAYSDEEHFLPMAPVLGLRQTRQFHTEERLTLNDLISHTRRDRSIGLTCSPLDTHSVDYEFEDDETLFWLWGCKHFRGEGYAELPYGLMIPQGLRNLWLACRAVGVTPAAAYGARMQRDIQRLGEAAGLAAVAAVRAGVDTRESLYEIWSAKLGESGALNDYEGKDTWMDGPLGQMASGVPGGYLWTLYQDREQYESGVLERLESADDNVSWLAAVVLAMWADVRAEPRLMRAIETRESGVPTPPAARGAHSQWIDVPNWFLAVNLLRMCGTAACLKALLELASQPGAVLDLRTSIALTLERLAPMLDESAGETAAAILAALVADEAPDRFARPSRSIYRALLGEEQKVNHDMRIPNAEDNAWRIALTVLRASRALGLPCPVDVTPWLGDERGLVRRAFTAAGVSADALERAEPVAMG